MHLTEIDHHTIVHMDIEEVRGRIAGKRGSRVVLTLTDRDGGRNAYLGGKPFNIILKRGAWGPEHCVVEPEDRDMVNAGSWPEMSEHNRYQEQAFKGYQRDYQPAGSTGNDLPLAVPLAGHRQPPSIGSPPQTRHI